MSFERDDWVRNKETFNYLVAKVVRAGSFTFPDGSEKMFLTLSNDMYLEDKIVEAWTPFKNDFCWFWDTDENLQLRQFEEMDGERFQPYGSVMGFKYCEPFIGMLPKPLIV